MRRSDTDGWAMMSCSASVRCSTRIPTSVPPTRCVWTKPSHQTKQKRTEHLPLSAPAAILVSELVESSPESTYLFPGNIDGEPLKDVKKLWASVVREAEIKGYRRHDNRHTYASHLVS